MKKNLWLLSIALMAMSFSACSKPGTAALGKPRAVLATNMGDITLELAPEHAPLSVKNFQQYCKDGHYDGTIFHRVISTFMIQGGGFTADMVQKPTREPIKNEAQNGLSNVRGSVAMARTAIVDSATAQFYINVVDNKFLDFRAPDPRNFGYAVFGSVVQGMEVVDKIKEVQVATKNGMENVPVSPIIINSCQLK